MAKIKKLGSVLILALMLVITGFLFAACNEKDYSKVSLSSSTDYLELYVEEEKSLTIKIENPVQDMKNTIQITQSNPLSCEIEQVSANKYTHIYSIKGLRGGRSVIEFVLEDGKKSKEVTVSVREYASELKAKETLLYVSSSTQFIPTSVDFKFEENITEKNLKYYFYGIKAEGQTLTLNDIKRGENYTKNFIKAEIYEKNSENYLIFTDENNQMFVLGNKQVVPNVGSIVYDFLSVLKTSEGYELPTQASSIKPGDNFTFVAVYDYEQEETLFCERDFSFLSDIKRDSIEATFGYQLEGIEFVKGTDLTSYKPEDETQGLVLIPRYTAKVKQGPLAGETIDFKTVYFELTLNSLNESIKTKLDFDSQIINVLGLGTTSDGNNTTYYFQINCANSKNITSNINITFYYEGFEDVDDENINFTYSIPVQVNIIPQYVCLDDVNLEDVERVTIFYNKYSENTSLGWKEFNLSVWPSESVYEKVEIDLIGSNLKLKYKNREYSNQVVEISELNSPIYLKGETDAQLSDEIELLPITLKFDIIGEDSITSNLKYVINKGASSLNFKTSEFENMIYLDVRVKEPILFKDIFTDAEFDSISFPNTSDSLDIVEFITFEDEPYIKEGFDYYLNFAIVPKIVGVKTYTIAIDNGQQISLRITVDESLDQISIQSENEKSYIRYEKDEIVSEDELTKLYYVYNKDNKAYFDVSVLAYGDKKSSAVTAVTIEIDNPIAKIDQAINNNKNFNVYLTDKGEVNVKLKVKGWQITDFIRLPDEIIYNINIISYNYITNLSVLKLSDGFNQNYEDVSALYANIYSNTTAETRRTVAYASEVESADSYLFFDPQTEKYVAETFDEKFIYFDSNFAIYQNGIRKEKMIKSSLPGSNDVYTLGSSAGEVGVFNVSTLTFTANASAPAGKLVIYAHIKQYGRLMTYIMNINIIKYKEVEKVSLQKSIEKIRFSILKTEASMVAYSLTTDATNPEITAYFSGGAITDEENRKIPMVKAEDVEIFESYGKYQITIKLNENYIERAKNLNQELKGYLFIVAKDWLDSGNNLMSDYQDLAIKIPVYYENGTENARITIENEEEFKEISKNLSAHYQISSAIDVSSISNLFPLGELDGSIIGTNDHASINGITISKTQDLFGGIFSKINQNAYIKDLTFKGKMQLNEIESVQYNIGLIAGQNLGLISNVGVELEESSVSIPNGNIGGLVGQNSGEITQDFSVYDIGNSLSSPKTMFFSNGELVVDSFGSVNVGGICGQNDRNSFIRKIDSTESNYWGYTNYMSYALIRSMNTAAYIGSIAGQTYGEIESGYIDYYGDYTRYQNDYQKGKGIIVGGELWGSYYIGGVAGKAENVISGVTTRTFVRGMKSTSTDEKPTITLIACFVESVQYEYTLENTFAVQAIDDGKPSEEASMFIAYNDDNYYDGSATYTRILNQLCFGNSVYTIASDENVKSFLLSRTLENSFEDIYSKTKYYGDVITISKNNDGERNLKQALVFSYGDEADLSVNDKFGNILKSEEDETIYYTYYFSAGKVGEGSDIADAQQLLDKNFNTLSVKDDFYPFIVSGEMIFTSKNPEILTIDKNGQIKLKKQGVALISATSLLNSNNALNFCISVVNYLNTDETIAVIYPNPTSTAIPFGDSTIKLRGNNSASLYVIPDYSLNIEGIEAKSDKYGNMLMNGLSFALNSNNNVTAYLYSENNYYNCTIIGSTITIRANENTEEQTYSLPLQPQLYVEYNEKTYTTDINKKLENTYIEYKHGATAINNEFYNEVVIHTSKKVVDNLVVLSTDRNEEAPLWQITSDNGYFQNDEFGLFNVSISNKENNGQNSQNEYILKYKVTITINRDYENAVYGDYYFTFVANSNEQITKTILVHYEKTNVNSVVIDNYHSLKDYESNETISSSNYAFTGQRGMLEIKINPEDSDFDYVLIENDESNYQSGKANANFGLLIKQGNEFVYESIAGNITSRGIRLSQREIKTLYGNDYKGIVYVQYEIGSNNVIDESISKMNVTIIKDNQEIFAVSKELRVKLQNFVTVTIDGKEGYQEDDAYISYQVARGLKYKLNVDSFGYEDENIDLSLSDSSIALIEKIGNEYYLQITSNSIDYASKGNFYITAVATQTENEVTRVSTSKTKINVLEYVLNYNNDRNAGEDIIQGMDEGIINVQVGSRLQLQMDLFDYIEYDENNNEIVAKINSFLKDLANKGEWITYTNLLSPTKADIISAQPSSDSRYNDGSLLKYQLKEGNYGANLYFNYNGLNVTPTKTHEPKENFYYVEYKGNFVINNGMYQAKTIEEVKMFTKFVLNVYTSSSEESPIPIYDYEDLLGMQNNNYYILLNDITLPTEADEENGLPAFSPIEAKFASFDGNGHSINFAGRYDMGSLSNFGLFKSIKQNSIVKNLNINFKDFGQTVQEPGDEIYALNELRTTRFVTTSESFTFGVITAENAGSITNCHVYTDKDVYLTVKADSAINTTSFIGGITGTNTGYITNCGVSANIKAPYYIAGVVAQNYGKIAACYYKGAKIINNSQFDQHIAGFVITNGENGQIITSYVAGEQTNNSIHSQDNENYLASTVSAAGFVYVNNGTIKDCYTDIDLSKTTSNMGGFAYYNSGFIKNAFSLSVLRNNVTASAGFVMFNSRDGIAGKTENCYYFYDEDENINNQIVNQTISGVKKLDEDGFANIEENFKDYSYSKVASAKSVWFFSTGAISDEFIDYLPTQEEIIIENQDNNKIQTNTKYEESYKVFGKNRLELVSPNIAALSIRNFSYSDYDEATGNVTYYYYDDETVPTNGSLHNPLLISDASSMENLISERSSTSHINTSYYRIINDIDYSNNFEGLSQLYKITFAGQIEGNGMSINQISMGSMERISNGGLFAQIGYSSNKNGVIKNLTISPRQIAFPNATSVGTLAGTAKYGYIYDINIKSVSANINVTGSNFVGGIIGRAITKYAIKDAYSNISVSAMYLSSKEDIYDESLLNSENYSYAGGIVGFAGTGEIYNSHLTDISTIMGGRAGSAFGGIGRGAKVERTFVSVGNNSTIKAYYYGGFVSGEVAGELKDSYVESNSSTITPFTTVPKVPTSIGGIAGILAGGKILNAKMEQSFVVANSANDVSVDYVGGLVGQVIASGSYLSTIRDSVVSGNITAGETLGGAVGAVSASLEMSGIAVKSSQFNLTGITNNPCLGGLVGQVEDKGRLNLSYSYCWADLFINCHTNGTAGEANVGGLIGLLNSSLIINDCYTTSKIDTEFYNLRSLGGLEEYTETMGSTTHFAYNQNVNASNVYYFGRNTENVSKYDDVKGKYVTFKTKTTKSTISLNVNNIGTSSLERAGDNITETEQDLYNLYIGEYLGKFGGEILTLNYDVYRDFYYTSSPIKNYFKNPNKENIYECVVSYDNSGEVFFIDDGNGFTYLYTGTIDGVTSTFYKNGVSLVSLQGNSYPISNIISSADLSTFKRYEQIDVSKLVNKKDYIDTKGEVYKITTEGGDYKLNNESYSTIEDLVVAIERKGLTSIWSLNPLGLTTLSMEENFSWIKNS